jgi:phospholipase C
MVRKALALVMSATIVMSGCNSALTAIPGPPTPPAATPTTASAAIKHVVVIFDENISFDHYFGTYPNAANTDGQSFTAATGTPIPDNYVSNPSLLTANPNLNAANGIICPTTNPNFVKACEGLATGTVLSLPSNPFRLSVAQAATGDQDHSYTPEQAAFDNGKLDLFPLSVGSPDSGYSIPGVDDLAKATDAPASANTQALTMAYYDGNTVTALWNYAQQYAMNDHSFGSTFGASTQGAINLASGQTNGVVPGYPVGADSGVTPDGVGGFTLTDDEDPTGDICSSTSANVSMSNIAGPYANITNKNIGDLLNNAGVTWGFFEGGFNLSVTNANGTTGCHRSTGAVNIPGHPLKADYIPHHQPFQYYASTANPAHNRPTSTAAIGTTDAANHQYDTLDFDAALAAGNLPAVSFLKAPGYQDGHAGYSDPLDEQTWLVNEINEIEKSSFWPNTAIIVAYDDSDGWYDHATDLVNGSATASDMLNGAGLCNSTGSGTVAPTSALPGPNSNGKPVGGRCGHGPRLPLLVISPWARKNFIDTTHPTDQASIPRFIEDVFLGSTRIGNGSFDASSGALDTMFDFSNGAAPPNPTVVQLDPTTGKVVSNK